MKTKTLLGLFVPLSLVCTPSLLAADEALGIERENTEINLHSGVKSETRPFVGGVLQSSKFKVRSQIPEVTLCPVLRFRLKGVQKE